MNWDSEFVMIFFLWGLPILFFGLLLTEKFKTRSYWVGGIILFFGCAIYLDPPDEQVSMEGESSFVPVEIITAEDESLQKKEEKTSIYNSPSKFKQSGERIIKKYSKENDIYSDYHRPTYKRKSNFREKVRVGAVCNDGTISQAIGSGACSYHGGVAYWLYE